MLTNKNLFYGEYSKSASEIRASFAEKLGDFTQILKNINSFKKFTNVLFKLNNYRKCVLSIEQGKCNRIVYDARYNNDSLHKMRISHDTLLEYEKSIVLNYDVLKQIIIDKYPYIFVNEYQDTNSHVIEILSSLIEYSKKINHPICVGYFGDYVQNIYDSGIGGKIHFHIEGFEKINKNFNRRSTKEIITIANKIRNDKIKQRSNFSDSAGGSVKLYRGTPKDTIYFIQKYKKMWNINNNNKPHCFVLQNIADLEPFIVLLKKSIFIKVVIMKH